MLLLAVVGCLLLAVISAFHALSIDQISDIGLDWLKIRMLYLIDSILLLVFPKIIVPTRRWRVQWDARPRTSARTQGGWSNGIFDWMHEDSKRVQRLLSHKMYRSRKEKQTETTWTRTMHNKNNRGDNNDADTRTGVAEYRCQKDVCASEQTTEAVTATKDHRTVWTNFLCIVHITECKMKCIHGPELFRTKYHLMGHEGINHQNRSI